MMSTASSTGFANYLARELRCAGLRARIAVNEIQFAGVALKGGLIDPNTAMEHLAEAGVLDLIIPSSAPSS